MDNQDQVDKGMFVFGQPVPFKQAFPTLADMKATVRIRVGGGMDGNPQTRHFSLDNPPGEYVRCPRAGCTNGGWNIADAIREMVQKGETHRETGGICLGQERMNRRDFRKCLTHFEADIDLTFKDSDKAA